MGQKYTPTESCIGFGVTLVSRFDTLVYYTAPHTFECGTSC